MERAFIVNEGSPYFKDYQKYKNDLNVQREFVNKFCKEKGIESNAFLVSGSGLVGIPFEERNVHEIRLGILPTKADKENFGQYLTVPKREGLCDFKANSRIAKEFAKRCVDEKIVINVWKPRLADCFKSVRWSANKYRFFEHNSTYYASIDSDYLDKNETPEGFTEIKMSELYEVVEAIQQEKGDGK